MWKVQLLRLFRNRQVFVFNLLVPLMMILIFGALFQGKPTKVAVSVPASLRQLVGHDLPGSSFVVVNATPSQARLDVQNGTAEWGLVILGAAPHGQVGGVSQGSAVSPVQGLSLPGADSALSTPVVATIYLQSGNTTANGAFQAEAGAVVAGLNQQLSGHPPVVLSHVDNLQVAGSAVRSESYVSFLTPGVIAYAITTAGMLSAGMQLVNDRERGALRRIRATPVRLSAFLGGIVAAQLVLIIIQTVILFASAYLFYGVAVQGSLLVLGLVCLAGAFCFLATGFLLVSVSKGPQAAITMANLFTLPQLFIAGIFYPLSSAPDWLQHLAVVMPLRYFSEALRSVAADGLGLGAIWGDLLFLLLFGCVAAVLALRTFAFEPRGGAAA